MDKQEIKTLLHHREPYLMIDRISEMDEKNIRAVKYHDGQEPHIQGHFPGAPVVPGAMLQEICTQSAALLITKYYSPVEDYRSDKNHGWALGVLNKVEYAKFLKIVKPDVAVEVSVELVDHVDNSFRFRAKVFQSDKVVAKLKFTLANISDEYLTQ